MRSLLWGRQRTYPVANRMDVPARAAAAPLPNLRCAMANKVPIVNPLTDKQCADIDCVLQSIPHVRATIEACERCGLDMSAEKERLNAQEAFATAVKREFNPLAP